MTQKPPVQIAPKVDPDPIVIDLLINLVAAAIGGAISSCGKMLFAAHRHRKAERLVPHHAANLAHMTEDQIGILCHNLDEIGQRIDQALALFHPGRKRELGGQILLDQQSLHRYHDLRDGLFDQIRSIDALIERIPPLETNASTNANRPRVRLPGEFREQLRFVDRKLREARTASLADEALLEVRSAVTAMRRLIEYIKSVSQY